MENVKLFGAAGDGIQDDTQAIQHAADQAAAADGEVYFPEGTYLTGTLFLRSGLHIRLSERAVLLGSPEIKSYSTKTHYNRYAGEHFLDRCLIYAEDAENIRISGGIIDGNGAAFYEEGNPDTVHPMLFRFLRCKNIRMNDLNIRMPAGWSTAFLECENIRISGISIISRHFNGDGLDFDSCRDVRVSDCMLDTSDDSLCIQNSVAERVSQNFVINNCIMKSRWAAVRIGLLNSGDIENVTISNCIFHDVLCSGLKIQAAEGGRIHNIMISSLLMKNVPRPVFVTSNYCRMGVLDDSPHDGERGIDGVYFKNIVIESDHTMKSDPAAGFIVLGTGKRKIKNIRFDDITYHAPGGWKDIPDSIPELEGKRPEYFSIGQISASAFYAAHIEGLHLERFTYSFTEKDARPPIVFNDVQVV